MSSGQPTAKGPENLVSRRGMEWRPNANSAARTLLAAAARDLGTEAERLARGEQLDIVNRIHVETAARNIKLRREGAVSNLLLAIGGLVTGACVGYLPTALANPNQLFTTLTLIGAVLGLVIFTIGAVLAILRKG